MGIIVLKAAERATVVGRAKVRDAVVGTFSKEKTRCGKPGAPLRKPFHPASECVEFFVPKTLGGRLRIL